jgi:lipopolysaccharide assembly outer membrane protein LptD (OstA)
MNARILATLAAALLLIAAVPKQKAPPALPGGGAGFSFSDWHVTTGELNANWENGNFTTPGRIVLTRPGSDIQADHATGNFKRHQATLTGNVVLHDNNGVLTNFAGQTGRPQPATLTCDNLNIDGTTKTYVATGNVHFTQGGSEVRADRAVMNGLTHDIHLYGNVQLQQ